jgi:hypothetical protein
MTDLDPDLAAALAASADERIRQRVAAAKARAGQLDAARARRNLARRHGVARRNAGRLRHARQAGTGQTPPAPGGGDAA